MKVAFAKPYLGHEEAQYAYDTILTSWVTQGPKVQEFEEKFAQRTGAKYATAVSNCTTALHLAMIVAGIQAGDEVICPSMSYIATANCIRYVGATPVFAEVNEDYNIDPNDVIAKITPKTKAILIVHQMGMPADIDAFKTICEQHHLQLIEDAACAIGSSYKGKPIGQHSDLVCFSFHPRKVITTGDGGMITTNRPDYDKRLKILRQHGMSVNDRARHEAKDLIFEDYEEVGYNYRMTDIQAAVGIKQLERLDWFIEQRHQTAKWYKEELNEIPHLQLPSHNEDFFTTYQSYSVLLKKGFPIERDALMRALHQRGIATRRGIVLIHQQIAYQQEFSSVALPHSEYLSNQSILLPMYVGLTQAEIQYVCNTLKEIIQTIPSFS
ncbi:MAG: DegT/DnrJ/EryC1/StrS family aminotransferase [Cytophagales bacterium]|nr:MAG: DegT/DnrJ/EryC1/StrS family aminotransferase [Cytophagales bacterium]